MRLAMPCEECVTCGKLFLPTMKTGRKKVLVREHPPLYEAGGHICEECMKAPTS